jgi:hypothetical protein
MRIYDQRGDMSTGQTQARCEQIERFGQIAEGIKESIHQSQNQYDSTNRHVDGVLITTQQVSGLAKQSLEYLNGGKSFIVVIPGVDLLPQPPTGGIRYTRDTQFSMFAVNAATVYFSVLIWGEFLPAAPCPAST